MSTSRPRERPASRPETPSDLPAVDGLGAKLRSLRRERGLALTQVGAATGISSSFLSLVENGKNDLTVARLVRLVSYYGVAVSDLLPDEVEQPAEILRREHQRHIPSRSEKMDLYLMTHEGNRAMTPVMATYEVGGGTHEFLSYDSEQWDHVLEGTLAVSFEGEEEMIVLNVGDSAYYSAKRPHKYKNIGDVPARALHVRSPGN
jgi:XRE family transcriptional regulator, regulator of sulfur utilization